MKKILKRFCPTPVWLVLRHLKNSPGLIWNAFDYYKMYGLQETWRKLKVIDLGRENNSDNKGLNSTLNIKDYVQL